MKAYPVLRNSVFTSIVFLSVTLAGCSPMGYIPEDQALVKKIEINGVDKEYLEKANSYIQKDIQPNSRINLALYNLVNTKNGKYRTDRDRIRAVGEPPHLLDSTLVELSRKYVEGFLKTKGFFKAKVESDIKIKKKKAYITLSAIQGPSFKVRNIDYVVPDTAVRSLYKTERAIATRLKPGVRYDRDSLYYEWNELVFRMMKEHGYYDYIRQNMRVDADTNLLSSQVDLKVYIDNPENKSSHQIYTVNNTFVTVRTSDGLLKTTNADTTVLDSQYYFNDHTLRFRSPALRNYIYFNKDDIYNVKNEEITYNRLYDLNVFKSLKIDYVKTSDSTNQLNPRIEAVPLKRMSNRIEGEYTFNSGRNGFNVSNTYTDRNLFGGAEQLELKFRYGLLFDSRLTGSLFDRVFNRDLQVGANLTLPRLLLPFPNKSLGRNGLSRTIISSSIQLFDQKNAFTNRIFINSIAYSWVQSIYKLHSLTPFNIEYRNGLLDDALKEQLRNGGYELYIQTNDRRYVNLGSQYTYTFNTVKLNTLGNFFYFRGSADVGGNTLRTLDKLFNGNSQVTGQLFGLSYLQYTKADVDLRLYRSLGGERQFVARVSAGLAHPLGNTDVLPFEKNFFAGGSSGIRAWQARTLGPGNYNRSVLSSDTLRANLRNLDQLGEIKFESNIEYRFKIVNSFVGAKLNGATFSDVGNIWRIPGSDGTPGGDFKLNKFIGQLAIGAGVGMRLDYDYFVFRFDAGIKIKDPPFSGSEQWVIRHLFDRKEFKETYSATNAPDVYRFVQYNFGIGMPF